MKKDFFLIVIESGKVVYIRERKAKRLFAFGSWGAAIVTYKGKNLRVLPDTNYAAGEDRKDFVVIQHDPEYTENHGYRFVPLHQALDFPEIVKVLGF